MELDKLKKYVGSNKVYVIGHYNPDIDTYCSSIILANMLKYIGINAVHTTTNINGVEMSKDLCNKFYVEYTDIEYHPITSKDYVFIVDHEKIEESNRDKQNNILYTEEQVIGCIDHHSIERSPFIFSKNDKDSSTCIMLYKLAKEINYDMSDKELKYVLYATCIDTNNFTTKSRINKEALDIRDSILTRLKLSCKDVYKHTVTTTDFSEPPRIIADKNRKDFIHNDVNIITTYVDVINNENEELNVRESILNVYRNCDLFVYIIVNHEQETTEVITVGGLSNKIGNIKYEGIISRKDKILPDIINVLNKLKF